MVPSVFIEGTGGESSERNAGGDSSDRGTLGCVTHRAKVHLGVWQRVSHGTKVHLAVCQLHRNRGHSVQSAAVMSLHYYLSGHYSKTEEEGKRKRGQSKVELCEEENGVMTLNQLQKFDQSPDTIQASLIRSIG